MSAWKVILSTLVIFIAGAITGGLLVTNTVRVLQVVKSHPKDGSKPAATSAANSNPWLERNKDLLRRMDRDLELTPDQHQHIETIIATSQERTRALWKPIAPQMNKEIQLVHTEIRDQLTPEQKTRFDALLKSRLGSEKRRPKINLNSTNSASTNLVIPAPSVTNAQPANP